MATIEVRIPQLGEGLQEARLVRFMKQPGEPVQRDEPIFEMETDKALMEIEAPAAGVLESWSAKEDDLLPIGAVIGRITTDEPSPPNPVSQTAGEGENGPQRAAAEPGAADSSAGGIRNAIIPPRTKSYALGRGLTIDEIAALARSANGKLLPESIDQYLERRNAPVSLAGRTGDYQDIALPPRQRTLVYHLQRSAQAVVPATIEMQAEWSGVEAIRARMKQERGDRAPTQFVLFAWCVAQTAKDHPAFRSALLNESTIRQYAHLQIGIAVSRPGDELLMARVNDAETLPLDAFAAQAQSAIDRTRNGEDQSSESIQLSLTNMASAGLRFGIPVVVSPAAGTLFIGAPFDEAHPLPGGGIGFRRVANMILTFDHRLANGIGAARFLDDIRKRVEGLRAELED